MTSKPLIYNLKKLIPGYKIEEGLTGFYAGIPGRGYKGKQFTIRYTYPFTNGSGELIYKVIELEVKDWNRAEKFRKFMDRWGRGAYTLGYFKMAEKI